MARHCSIGNGHTLALFDENGYIRDLYFPYAGFENHVVSLQHRIGVSVNNTFYWVKDLQKQVQQDANTLKANLSFDVEGINYNIESLVYNEKNVLVRKVTIKNNTDEEKQVKTFFNQEFRIKENKYRNTGYYYPEKNVVVHYRGKRVFLTSIESSRGGMDDYTIGIYGFDKKEGSYKNAEKINLSKNPVEHGPVDSVIAKTLILKPKETNTIYYILLAEKSVDKSFNLYKEVKQKGIEHIFKSTCDYWHAWKNQRDIQFNNLSNNVIELFYKSLFLIRTHSDKKSGGILASGDSTYYEYGKDSYAYVWARDALFPSIAMDDTGYYSISKKLLNFFSKVISKEGYILHKFEQDTSLGSSWHPWINDGVMELPIQEDETAAVILTVYNNFKRTKDIEALEKNYNNLVKKPADFMCNYINKKLDLPEPSYDLWEAKYMVTTYTTCSVISALKKASKLSKSLGKADLAEKYKLVAERLKKGLKKHLYKENIESYIKGIYTNDSGDLVYEDYTADSSTLFGLWYFGVFKPNDKRVINTEKRGSLLLSNNGYYIRFENDDYFKEANEKPNFWVITTLWNIQLQIKRSKSYDDLKDIPKQIENIANLATKSGMLPEQVAQNDLSPRGYCPLVWSHATYIQTITMYLRKLEKFEVCKLCLPK